MSKYYLAFDCETTGLLSHCNVLTCYFVILDNQLNIIDELELNIKYSYYIVYTQAMRVNKIDLIKHDKIAINQKKANELLINFLSQYSKYKLIGHNIKFDIDMLKSNLILSKEEIKKYFDLQNIYDTYKIAKLLKSQNKINKCQSLSLSKICYYFDITNSISDSTEEFHNAKYDTLCTIELFKKLIELKKK